MSNHDWYESIEGPSLLQGDVLTELLGDSLSPIVYVVQ
jgi:hypothetical protein